ncbi:MAG: hypothetical protein WEE36_11460 [Acidimicrobiia bacterium]
MRGRVLFLALVLGASLVPATALADKPGIPDLSDPERISLFGPSEIEYPESTPFHLWHGWGISPAQSKDLGPAGLFSFYLDLDGVPLGSGDPIFSTMKFEGETLISRLWLYEFPDGMTGTHTFTGHWLGPCVATSGPCDHKNEVVEVLSLSVTVTFTP